MQLDQIDVRQKLERIVVKAARDPSWYDELFQEAVIHLWWTELRDPGHTKSWYLQNCDFYLRKLMNAGRSLDSIKRLALRTALPANSDDEDGMACPETISEESPYETVCLWDLVSQLLQRLRPLDGRILKLLTEGDSVSEIARKLHVSHTCVAKHRRTIKRVAVGLGLNPAGERGRCCAEGSLGKAKPS